VLIHPANFGQQDRAEGSILMVAEEFSESGVGKAADG
jgi:hypothetical protein